MVTVWKYSPGHTFLIALGKKMGMHAMRGAELLA